MALLKRNRQTINADYDFDQLARPAEGWGAAACRICSDHLETSFHLRFDHFGGFLPPYRPPDSFPLRQEAVIHYLAHNPHQHLPLIRFLQLNDIYA